MKADPQPWRRCRCVFRYRGTGRDDPGPYEGWPNDFIDRCPDLATQEDGLCDHCRQPVADCETCGDNWPQCCRQPSQSRHLVPIETPCWDRTAVPF